MQPDFWHRRWENNQIGFHNSETHPMLPAHFENLAVPQGGRVFVPLCGKTLDIHWLLANFYRVVGAELSRIAIEQLFQELGLEPVIAADGAHQRFSADGIDIFVGDIFDLTAEKIAPVDAIYDRAALVALPRPLRDRYARHLAALAPAARQLLITFDYDQSRMDGPPFAVSPEECLEHYRGSYDVRLLSIDPVPGGLKGVCEATESTWLLTPR